MVLPETRPWQRHGMHSADQAVWGVSWEVHLSGHGKLVGICFVGHLVLLQGTLAERVGF